MPSVFAWVDFAEQDRRKMAEVVDLFREQDTRDELGLGMIRAACDAYHFSEGASDYTARAAQRSTRPARAPSEKIAL